LPGQLFQHKGDNISNIYNFINKTNNDFDDIHFKLVGINGSLKVVGKQELPRQGMNDGTLFIKTKIY
jgi:hypothetical protein